MTDSTTNVYHDGNGNLAIKPLRDSAGRWTSGRVETRRTDFAAPAGGRMRMEARIQQPNVTGAAAAGYCRRSGRSAPRPARSALAASPPTS